MDKAGECAVPAGRAAMMAGAAARLRAVMAPRILWTIFPLAAATVLLAGCGQAGLLYLPDHPPPKANLLKKNEKRKAQDGAVPEDSAAPASAAPGPSPNPTATPVPQAPSPTTTAPANPAPTPP